MNQLQALEEEDGPAGTSKGNQLEHLSGPSMMMSLVTTSCSANEERSAVAQAHMNQQSQDTSRELHRWEIQSQAFHDQRLDNQLQIHPVASNSSSRRELHCTSCCYESRRKMMYQSRATVDPVVSFSAIAYPVDMVSRRKKSRSSEAQQLKNEPAAKQLTTYEELSKLDVNC
ncbi:O-linked N-acetyl glucosamine transferase family protein [Dorcoceras hygrometricum]|uniref:O-linked N-acetyl glucosamine transferase family protein n=1 Tax=Dorcoceras hygrometricum TaxID=472368 RepID=A0A2Z7B985_9LAMI|nr:O-linked N-acetyl glucosamine transferase family protein [Dorcoceras hygrometricum]